MNTATPRWQALQQELRGNPRLQVGLLAVAGILLLSLWWTLGDWRMGLAKEIDRANERLARVNQLADQDEWLVRAEAAQSLRATLEAEIPAAASAGLAQAAFQSWLSQLIGSLSVRPQLTMEAPVVLEQPHGMVRIAATLTGSLPARQWPDLLRRIEGDRNLLVIPTLQLRSDTSDTYTLTLHAFYRLQTGPDAGVGP